MIAKKDIYNDFSVIDLFCGVGGLSHGFFLEGIKVMAGIDSDKTCKYAYEKNNHAKFILEDISNINSNDINEYFLNKKKRILVGCAPCQDFSIYNQKNNKSGKWKLLKEFARIIEDLQPEIVSMENVPQLRNYEDGDVLNEFTDILSRHYNCTPEVVNAQEYGIPQRRKRLIILACKKDKGRIELITPNEFRLSGYKFIRNVKEAISHLAPIQDGQVYEKDALHRARKLSEINKKRIKATKEGGFWRDWPDELILDCHKEEKGKSFGSVYGRMKWADVSPTMTTYCVGLGNGRFGHPEQDRAISLREAAIFQSFPDSYEFINPNENFAMMTIARQIGNAVPVGLGRVIAQSIKKHIENSNYE